MLAMDEQDVRMFVLLRIICLNLKGVVGRCLVQYEVVIVSNSHVLSKYNTMAMTALRC